MVHIAILDYGYVTIVYNSLLAYPLMALGLFHPLLQHGLDFVVSVPPDASMGMLSGGWSSGIPMP